MKYLSVCMPVKTQKKLSVQLFYVQYSYNTKYPTITSPSHLFSFKRDLLLYMIQEIQHRLRIWKANINTSPLYTNRHLYSFKRFYNNNFDECMSQHKNNVFGCTKLLLHSTALYWRLTVNRGRNIFSHINM